MREPRPVYVTRGEGSRLWDADGNEYVDLHNGFGAILQGHAHPAVTASLQARAGQGTHFGAPTEDVVAVAEELARRSTGGREGRTIDALPHDEVLGLLRRHGRL